MNDNYLWDKTGEVDKEVADLEKLLSELRYHPQPLPLATTHIPYFSWNKLAVAAMVMVMLTSMVWLTWYYANKRVPMLDNTITTHIDSSGMAVANGISQVQEKKEIYNDHTIDTLPTNKNKNRYGKAKTVAANKRVTQELLLALYLTNAKLNLVQKKVQEIHN